MGRININKQTDLLMTIISDQAVQGLSNLNSHKHGKQKEFPYINESALLLKKAFVFNSKFYLSNKIKVTKITNYSLYLDCVH